ncbi:MAG TPA: DUF3368 domain-containing protein [Nitrospiraceae bacterium]|nr:MAG: hypothetical protein A2035_08810 [Nitrospirae bacterium GWA2_42_11]OGW53044.1 MAG: hypothetical protein A2Z60_01665 [Nitrospirae bacterium RIFCSPLOWO2_02_42_7]OGW56698.1 MAG: hypothetical protein A3D21_04070 [Nitrospirae bacterium RIFCSPHIGHO2_02_FULL_42_12]HAS17965.1 DUF3368 domain-containing protein [Nitrospiraceae bacterium]HBI25137.1 DUF3368 domain-containing protein [Nitrospiraceae bacterium]
MIVSNSSCLIVLDKLGKLELLERLYTKITIPKAVKDEVFKGKSIPGWIGVVNIKQPIAPRILERNLGYGESEAISLSLELNTDLLIVDDLAARKVAVELGINITGVIGILLEAKKKGLVQNLKYYLDKMQKHDFRISKAAYDLALELAKEKE